MRRVLCALLLGPAFAAHADFSWELTGLIGEAERSDGFGSDFDSDLVALSGTYYFDFVEDGSGPHALAAFLDPATLLTVAASEERTASRFSDPFTAVTQIEVDIRDYSLSGVYLLSESKWYAGGRYSRRDLGDLEISPPPPPSPATVTSSTDRYGYGLVAGKYFGSGATRLELSLDRAKSETESSVTFCAPTCVTSNASAESTTDTARLGIMHVRRFRSATYALLGGIGETQGRSRLTLSPPMPVTGLDPEPFNTYFVGAELYPVRTIGVRVGYAHSDGPTFKLDDISVGASWFVRRNVGLQLTLSREDSEVLPSTERAALRVVGRL